MVPLSDSAQSRERSPLGGGRVAMRFVNNEPRVRCAGICTGMVAIVRMVFNICRPARRMGLCCLLLGRAKRAGQYKAGW